MNLSIIVPMLDEERAIAPTLQALRRGAPDAEIICVDGGSADSTRDIAAPLCDRVLIATRGRARQMNAGAAVARGDTLVFVHADTLTPPDFAIQVATALADESVVGGRFDVLLDDPALRYRFLSWSINARSRLMQSATGDQAIFVRRAIFEQLGSFPEIDLCEDVAFCRELRRIGRVACLRAKVQTSARRWREHGFLRTILRMWAIKAQFLLGIPPARLKRKYIDVR